MGAYVYYVTARKIALTDGTVANLAQYAYKPSYDTKFNQRLSRACKVKPALASQLTGRIVFDDQPGTKVYRYRGTQLLDDSFDYAGKRYEGLFVANPKAAVQNLHEVRYVDKAAIAMTTPPTHPVVTVTIPADTYDDAALLVWRQDQRRVMLKPGQAADAFTAVQPVVPARGDLLGDLTKVPAETLTYSAFDWE